jgi:Ras homolog enriched in brain
VRLTQSGFRWATGKSSLTSRISDDTFPDGYDPTIETTSEATVTVRGRQYLCEIVDTAGQDEYSVFPRHLTVGVHGYVLVYSVTSRPSFELVRILRDKLLAEVGSAHIVLVGNKVCGDVAVVLGGGG